MSNYPLIPFFKTTRIRVKAMIELAHILPGEKACDLGSGDGRIAIALAQQGAIVTGFELDAQLISLARKNIHKSEMKKNITIFQKDFWAEDLSPFTLVTIYPMPDIMHPLEKKLLHELKPGSRVLTNYYSFPTWKEQTSEENVHLYVVQ